MKYIMLSCCFVLLCSKTLATAMQDAEHISRAYSNAFISTSPTNMYRYGDVGTSLFTGKAKTEIPIYKSNDPDFDVSISLNYLSEGFKPNKHSGYVGYNWFLSCGGSITREVKNFPDDLMRRNIIQGGYNEIGMLVYTNSNTLNPTLLYNIDTINTFRKDNASGIWYINTGNVLDDVDYLPDVFHFNFCGYSGDFIIDNNGSAKVVRGDFVSVDMSSLLDIRPNYTPTTTPTPLSTSSITIRTLDGYIYVFGGDISSVDFSLHFDDNQNIVNQMNPHISTWHLRSITAPNGRKMNFHYRPLQMPINVGGSDPLWVYVQNYYSKLNFNGTSDTLCVGKAWTKESILDSISTNGIYPLRISFKNSTESKGLYYRNLQDYSKSRRNLQLDSIIVRCGNRCLRRVGLNYEYKSRHRSGSIPGTLQEKCYSWRFLRRVEISGIGNYELTYNHSSQYPEVDDAEIIAERNTFGYMSGSGENYYLGMLTKIVFPTGGSQQFTYGRHYFSTLRRYKAVSATNLVLEDVSQSDYTNGVRIEQIQTLDGDDIVETRTYNYSQSDNSLSSGILYNFIGVYDVTPYHPTYRRTKNEYHFLESHIGYERVVETVAIPSSNYAYSNEYIFDTGISSFSSLDEHNSNHINWRDNNNSDASLLWSSGMLSFDNFLHKPGVLIDKRNYNSNNELIKREQYRYRNTTVSGQMPAMHQLPEVADSVVVLSCMYMSVTRKLYIQPNVLEQEVISEYNPVTVVAMRTTLEFSYDNKLRVKKRVTIDSEGIRHFISYQYPDYFNLLRANSTDAKGLRQMSSAHRIDQPVEILEGYESGNNNYITSGKVYTYRPADSLSNPVIPPCLSSVKTLKISSPIDDYIKMQVVPGWVIRYDSRYSTDCTYTFNSLLLPISMNPTGKAKISYAWDYVYPLSVTNGNQTISYTFIPGLGINSMTDSRGLTTYYEYDNFGRLIEEYRYRNNAKEILKSYFYNIPDSTDQ